ncbi:MAG: lipopolysaccharide biosynthesis protein, partial [Caldilineales bacterium]|nr:lipopolysaccharide biosynthesis protein [Caldilineales bacterium]
MTFRTQVVSSAAWAGASNILIKMFSFVAITLVLARVLDVADFGLVAVALLAINSIDLFREFGIASALIYRQAEGEEDVSGDVAHISLIVGGVIVYAAIYLAAPWVEAFFKDAAGVTPVLRALGLIVLINSFSQTPYTLLAKRLHFRAKAIPEIIGGLLNSIIAILLALRGFGVWALVAGYLTDAATRTLLVWFFSSWRPRWRFDRRVWREMAAYGRHIVGSRLLIFGITNIDDLLVGRMLGTASLGYYGLAYRLSNVPATHVTSLINSVMFPAFSLIQKEQERVRRVYFDTMHAVGLVSIPLAVGTLLLGPFFVHQYYLGKWDGAIVAMQWLTIYGLMRSIAANLGNIYRALGKPQWLTYLALWRFLTMLALLLAGCGDKDDGDDTGAGDGGGTDGGTTGPSIEDFINVTDPYAGDIDSCCDLVGEESDCWNGANWVSQTPDPNLQVAAALNGDILDFETGDPVADATLELWFENDPTVGAPDYSVVGDGDGYVVSTFYTCKPVAYKVSTDPALDATVDTYELNQIEPFTKGTIVTEFNSVSSTTYAIIPSLLGVSPDGDKGTIAGTAY